MITVDKLAVSPGERMTLGEVILQETDEGVVVGRPTIAGAAVEVEVLEHARGRRVEVFKFRRRKNYRRRRGHRQAYTVLKVVNISGGNAGGGG